MRRVALLFSALLLAPGLALGGTGPEARLDCPEPTTAFPPSPFRAAEPASPTTLLRNDPDGRRTLVAAIDEPYGGPYEYVYVPYVGGTVYSHRWQHERELVTVGLLVGNLRVPLAVLEEMDERTVLSALAAGDVTLEGAAAFLGSLEPGDHNPGGMFGGETAPPGFVWTTYRHLGERELWSGVAYTRQANSDSAEQDAVKCMRIEALAVVRTEAGTTSAGGIYATITESRIHSGDGARYAYGLSAGATSGGIDTPAAYTTLQTTERAEGEAWREEGLIAFGLVDERGRSHPLVGVRTDTTHAAPPHAFSSMASLGVFRADGEYFPQLGARTHYERHAPPEWLEEFMVSGGPGSPTVGDWEHAVGVFDPLARFVPVAGAAYDDSLSGVGADDVFTGVTARHPHQAFVTAGVFALDAYRPLVGATFDGEAPLLAPPRRDESGAYVGNGRSQTSAGVFPGVGGYVPLVGTTHQSHRGYTEYHTAGVYGGAYYAYVPATGALWTSDRPSTTWLAQYAGNAPSNATLDAGPVVLGEFVPLARVAIDAGGTDWYRVAAFGPTRSIELLAACTDGRNVGARALEAPVATVRLPNDPLDPTTVQAAPLSACGS